MPSVQTKSISTIMESKGWGQLANRESASMVLFDKIRENAEAIRLIGERAVEEAKRLGVPCHYMDPSLCDGIVREMPDGNRQHVELKDGEEIVVETFGPRVTMTH